MRTALELRPDPFAVAVGVRRGRAAVDYLDALRPSPVARAALAGELAELAAGRLTSALAVCRRERPDAPLVVELTAAVCRQLLKAATDAHPGHELVARLGLEEAQTLFIFEETVHRLKHGARTYSDPLDLVGECDEAFNPYACASAPRGVFSDPALAGFADLSFCPQCADIGARAREVTETAPRLELPPAVAGEVRRALDADIRSGASEAELRSRAVVRCRAPLSDATVARLCADAEPMMWHQLVSSMFSQEEYTPAMRWLEHPSTGDQLAALAGECAAKLTPALVRYCSEPALVRVRDLDDDKQLLNWQRRMRTFDVRMWEGLREAGVELDGEHR